MKKIVFIVCFLMLVKPVVPVLEYVFDYQYISQELCVNKELPIMGCNGKCYLMKELAKASESEKPISSDKKHTISETTDLFFESGNSYNLFAFSDDNPVASSHYLDLYESNSSSFVFRPPVPIS